jgi:hypothetical protein
MEKNKIIMIGVSILFLILILHNITFVNAKPVETTETTTIIYRKPGNQPTYYTRETPNYNSYKAQYYN